ncbi:MAG: hypothetical protein WA110_00240 [Anaerolineaceae bacterium]
MAAGPFFFHDPIGLTLSADQQFSPLHPTLDAVWQISLDPDKALSLNTCFALQAREFRLFPVFQVNNRPISLVKDFFSQPRVDKIHSNYASLVFSPTSGFQVRYEIWVEQSTALLSRFTITNINAEKADFGVQVAGLLSSIGNSTGMTTATDKSQSFLEGSTGDIAIAVALDGVPKPVESPFPALQWLKQISPAQSEAFQWRCVFAGNRKECLAEAFKAFPTNWDAEISRVERAHQANLIEVNTPYADWDAVFLTCQNQACQSLVRTEDNPDLLRVTPVRNTEHSYAQYFSAEAHPFFTKPSLSMLPLFQLSQVLLPARPEIMRELIVNTLAKTDTNRLLPVSRRKVLPFPCLVSTVWKTFLHLQDREFLAEVFPFLRETTPAWFDLDHDQDQDGLPEWTTFSQTGFHGSPCFDVMSPKGLPTRISTTESAGLAGLLDTELAALEAIARVLEDPDTQETCQVLRYRLQERLQTQMKASPGAFTWDRDSHLSPPEEVLFKGRYSDLCLEPILLRVPSRINIMVLSGDSRSQTPELKLAGVDAKNQPCGENIPAGEVLRLPDYLSITSRQVYQQLNNFTFPGLDGETDLMVYATNLTHQDISRYLIWQPQEGQTDDKPDTTVNLPETEPPQAPFGLPEYEPGDAGDDQYAAVNPAWNSLIMEYLLQVGSKSQVLKCFSQLMQGSIHILKQEHTLYDAFGSLDAHPIGARNAIAGLMPLEVFLNLVGVRFSGRHKVTVSGENPLPWPVTISFQGLAVCRDGKNTTVTMPDGLVFHHFGSQSKTFQGENRKEPPQD